ncbi:hypothetical protein Ciccas_009706 [Cichlidogyrus casuarinus]|uniref:AMP-dependent synthetase/ligase domain-containing protein n=1 Tax=Cichlidogyrus casuarinus TaxID=1844966 RepID=A0ABD2PXA3_9PLAT
MTNLVNLSVKKSVSCLICFKRPPSSDLLQTLCLDDFNFYIISFKFDPSQVGFDFAYAIQTSGTTGKEKTVLVQSKCLLPNIEHLAQLFGVRIGEKSILISAPITFDPSLVLIFLALKLRVPIVFSEQTPGVNFGQFLREARVGFLQCTPSHLLQFDVDSVFSNEDLLICFGGELVPKNLLSKISARSKHCVYSLYGITEVSSWASVLNLTENLDYYRKANFLLGQSLYQTQMRKNEKDELEIRRDCGGYCSLKQEEDIRKALVDPCWADPKWESSGDQVFQHEKGFCYLSRTDQVVKRFGQKVDLILLESTVREGMQSISECYAIHDEDNDLHLVCALADSEPIEDLEIEINGFISRTLGSAYLATDIEFIRNESKGNLLSAHGKLMRNPYKFCIKLLRSLLGSKFNKKLKFNDAGGDSLKAVFFVNCLTDKYRLNAKTRTIFLNSIFNDCLSTFLSKTAAISAEDQSFEDIVDASTTITDKQSSSNVEATLL